MAMLQFSMTLYTVAGRFILRPSRMFAASLTSKTSEAPDIHNINTKEAHDLLQTKENVIVQNTVTTKNINVKPKVNGNQLQQSVENQNMNALLSKKIDTLTSVDELLNVVKIPNISRTNILKIMSNVTNLINQGSNDVENIQNDKRFINMQKILTGRKVNTFSDISRIELEALSQYSIPTMILEMSKLAENRDRNLPLLRFFSFQINEYANVLSPKSCVNILFSMAVLNFLDESLLEKINTDLSLNKAQIRNSSLSSIMWSIGKLRYKNEHLLEFLCDLILEKKASLKPSQRNIIAQTFAILGYKSEKANAVIKDVLLPLKLKDLLQPEWINYVWSLIVLDQAKDEHLEAVLNKEFVTKQLEDKNLTKRLKLLNINAAARYLVKTYKGSLLDEKSEIFKTEIEDSKDRKPLLTTLYETLSAMLSTSSHFTEKVNTEMGFAIDAVCYMDSKCNFIKVDNRDVKTNEIIRIAIMLHHFNDYTRGKKDLLGLNDFRTKLLQEKGFRVLHISYEHLSPEDKLIKRVRYLNDRINSLKNELSS